MIVKIKASAIDMFWEKMKSQHGDELFNKEADGRILTFKEIGHLLARNMVLHLEARLVHTSSSVKLAEIAFGDDKYEYEEPDDPDSESERIMVTVPEPVPVRFHYAKNSFIIKYIILRKEYVEVIE